MKVKGKNTKAPAEKVIHIIDTRTKNDKLDKLLPAKKPSVEKEMIQNYY